MNKLVAATVSAAVSLASASPALAQETRFTGFDAPRGLTATANLRVPLGREAKSRRATYGLSLGLGREVGAGYDGRPVTRSIPLAELRFSGEGRLSRAALAGVDLDRPARQRMNLTGGGSTTWFVLGAIAAAAGICLLTDCLDGDDDDSFPTN